MGRPKYSWVCTVQNCDKKGLARRLCGMHYARLTRNGSLQRRTQDTQMSSSREYLAWRNMWSRCTDEKDVRYITYGERGIRVCERWELFNNFYADMGAKPTPKHTLERINNDGDYEPSNCRWATYKEQANNKTTTKKITFRGVTLTQQQWAEKLGIKSSTLHKRFKLGWSIERALTSTVRPGGKS